MESVTIELRPRLRSCNVFVSLGGISDQDQIRTKLNKDFITLRIAEQSFNFCLATIRIIPNSLSSLRVGEGWLSFRVQTTPVNSVFGSFETELLGTPASSRKKNLLGSSSSVELPPKGTNLQLSCTCCDNVLTNRMNFEKVLPLPDDDCEPAEWFCCSHDGADYSRLLEPRIIDYFYGPFYCVLNRNNFVSRLKIHSDAVVCNRCLANIGSPHSEDSLKIWNCSVERTNCDSRGTSKKRADPLADFKVAVMSCVDDFLNERILLEATECGKTRYLLIKPMEWNLDLLVAPRDNYDPNAIILEPRKVAKILYDYGETKASRSRDFPDAKHRRIGLKCFLAGLELLVASSKLLPPIYRNAEEYRIGYINLDDSR